MQIHNHNHVSFTRKGTKFDLTTNYRYPLRKYCVKTNGGREYCSCDVSILDLTMDIEELKPKL